MGTPKELMPNAQDMNSFKIYAELVYKSGKYPKWIRESKSYNADIGRAIKVQNTEEEQIALIMMVLLAGWELNVHPLQALAKINFATDGKLQVEGELFLALIKREYPNHYLKIDANRIGCKIEAKCNKDDPNEPMYVREFTMDDAKLAHLTDPRGDKPSLYITYPRHMLKWGAIREMKGEKFPDVLFGATLDSVPVMQQIEEETNPPLSTISPKILIPNETQPQIPDATVSMSPIIAEAMSAMPKMPEFTLKTPEPVKEEPKLPEPVKETLKIPETRKMIIHEGITNTETGENFVAVPQKITTDMPKPMGLPDMKPVSSKKSTSLEQAIEIGKAEKANPTIPKIPDLSFLDNIKAIVKAEDKTPTKIVSFPPETKVEEKVDAPKEIVKEAATKPKTIEESFGLENLACDQTKISEDIKFWFGKDWFASTRDKREATGDYPLVIFTRLLGEAFPNTVSPKIHDAIIAYSKQFIEKKDKTESMMNVYHDAAISAIHAGAGDYGDIDLKFLEQMKLLIIKLLQGVKPLIISASLTDEALCVKILGLMNWTKPKYANWAYNFLKKRGYIREKIELIAGGKQINKIEAGIEKINV